MVESSYVDKKFFVAASIFNGCGSLLLLFKDVQNDAHCNYIVPP